MMQKMREKKATLDDAIYCVRSQLGQGECKDCRLYKRRGSLDLCEDVNETILSALEEIRQYRKIGLTPQMVKDLIKSEKKAHKIALENAGKLDECVQNCKHWNSHLGCTWGYRKDEDPFEKPCKDKK